MALWRDAITHYKIAPIKGCNRLDLREPFMMERRSETRA